MPRIRHVKHDTFLDEELAQLPVLCRYTLVGLDTLADRLGRLEDRPARIKAQLFPYEPSVDMDDVLAQLSAAPGRFVERYEVGSVRYLQLRDFLQRQHPNARETESTIPAPPGRPVEALVAASVAHIAVDDTHVLGDARTCVHVQDEAGDESRSAICSDGVQIHPSHVNVDARTCMHMGDGIGDGIGNGNGDRGRDPAPRPAASPTLPSPLPVPRGAWLSLVECWNRACSSVPGWTKVSTNLQPASQALLMTALRTTPDLDAWDARFARAAASDHLTGRNGKGFVSTLWWLLEHVDKLDAGQYDDRETRPAKVAALTGGGRAPSAMPVAAAHLCPHKPTCGSRNTCALVTAKEVRAGAVALDEVQPAIIEGVREFLEYLPQAKAGAA